MPKAEYSLLWKVKYKPEWAQGRINRHGKNALAEGMLPCTMYGNGKKHVWACIFNGLSFFFFLLVTSGGGLLHLTGSVTLFLQPHIEESGSQTPAGTHPRFTLAPREEWAAWRGAAKFKPCLELCALPR